MTPAAAAHLAELDARYEAHVAALHEHANEAKEMIASGSIALEAALPRPVAAEAPRAPYDPPPLRSSLDVEEPPPYVPPPPNPYSEHALIPDVPIGMSDDHFSTVDDDGIPLWQD